VSAPEGSASLHWQPLRFRDLDAFGHVYHAEYLTLLDEARTRWLGDVVRIEDPGSYVVAHLEIDYLSSLTLDDEAVGVRFAVLRVGRTSLTVGETMHARDGRVVARGQSVAVLRDRATGSSRSLSERERSSAEAALATPDAERG
jgi:acyl-CoA thioester hydrolase